MSNHQNKDSIKSQRYRVKRQTKRYPLDFYLDDDRQANIYQWLERQDNKKEIILQSLEQTMAGDECCSQRHGAK